MLKPKALKDCNVLLVEDERVIAEHVTRMLERIGVAKTIRARTAEDAWDILFGTKRQPVSAMVVDLILPGVNGGTLIQKLRETKQPAALAMPIVVLTGRNDVKTYNQIVRFRIGAYLMKPCSDTQLKSALEEALAGRFIRPMAPPVMAAQ